MRMTGTSTGTGGFEVRRELVPGAAQGASRSRGAVWLNFQEVQGPLINVTSGPSESYIGCPTGFTLIGGGCRLSDVGNLAYMQRSVGSNGAWWCMFWGDSAYNYTVFAECLALTP
jgi:hypothetical protein